MTVPVEATRTLPILERVLGDSLLAVYLHGSAVAGGLRTNSDVDLIAVVDQPLGVEPRERLVAELMQLSGMYPPPPGGPRPIELIVFQRADLVGSAYPARSEFIYGEWLRAAFETGATAQPSPDPEFTLVLAQARAEARTLLGPDPGDLLPSVSQAEIRRAIGDALPALLDNLEGDERNVLLTLARMWRTLATGDFVPKDVAAEWAIPRLPAEAAAVLAGAREAYLGLSRDVKGSEVQSVAGELAKRVMAMVSSPN